MNVRGAVAVVTGGGSGIGLATCTALRAEGATVVSWDLEGGDVPCDVSSERQVQEAMATTVRAAGVPTVLVAAAGLSRVARLETITVDEWDRFYAVNVRGVFLSLRSFVHELLAQGSPGSAVLVGSVNGYLADSAHSMYSSTKAAVHHLARCAAAEYGGDGIRVNAIAPGPTETPMIGGALEVEGYLELIQQTTPLGRIGRPEDVADVVLGVLRSDWVTGAVVPADGGAGLVSPRGDWRARVMLPRVPSSGVPITKEG